MIAWPGKWLLPSHKYTYSVLRTDGAVGHLLQTRCVQELLDLGQPLYILSLCNLPVDGFQNLPGSVDAPLDDVVLLRIGLTITLLQQLLQEQRVLDQTLVLHR